MLQPTNQPTNQPNFGIVTSVADVEDARVYFDPDRVEFSGRVNGQDVYWVDQNRNFLVDTGDSVNDRQVGTDPMCTYTELEQLYPKMHDYVTNSSFAIVEMFQIAHDSNLLTHLAFCLGSSSLTASGETHVTSVSSLVPFQPSLSCSDELKTTIQFIYGTNSLYIGAFCMKCTREAELICSEGIVTYEEGYHITVDSNAPENNLVQSIRTALDNHYNTFCLSRLK